MVSLITGRINIRRLNGDSLEGDDSYGDFIVKQEPLRLPSRQAEFDETDRLSLMRIVIIRQ